MNRSTFLARALILGAAFLTVPTAGAVAAEETKPAKAEAKPAKPASKTDAKADTKSAKGTGDVKPAKGAAVEKSADKPADKQAEKAGPPPANSSPMAELKKSNEKLDKILSKNRPNWSPEAELQREEVRKLVGSFLDYNELARRSLARHWEAITPKQREDFVNTLRDLVERSYLKQVHGNANYNIKYDKEIKDGIDATVTGVLNTVARGKKVKIALEYKMLWRGDHWVVYDVVTDEQSMVENYRAEFNKIINKDGFDALLKRMKKKLDEKEE
jgi:phospholipid transport system substrate-binding protein